MENKLIDFLVPRPEEVPDAVYEQLDLLRELFAQTTTDPTRSAVSSMLEAVISWADQVEA
jgi:hypothetical protein